MLSKQKFSSNVIEKVSSIRLAQAFISTKLDQCLRIADVDTRHHMIDELLRSHDFDRLVDDAFANYVIQTAVSVASTSDLTSLTRLIICSGTTQTRMMKRG